MGFGLILLGGFFVRFWGLVWFEFVGGVWFLWRWVVVLVFCGLGVGGVICFGVVGFWVLVLFWVGLGLGFDCGFVGLWCLGVWG